MHTKVPRTERCVFPLSITTEDGKTIECPEEWRAP